MTDGTDIYKKKGSDYEEQKYCDEMARSLAAAKETATAAPVSTPATPTTAAFNASAPKEPKNVLLKWATKIASKLDNLLARAPD